MTMGRMMRTVLALALTAPRASGAAAFEVRHEPLSCVPRDRYARVSAQGVPAEEAVRAEVQLRTGPQAAWYAIDMAAAGAEWSALLPRAMPSLSGFEYRIVMTSRALSTASTAPLAVRVTEGSSECAAATQDALDASIVVRVPPGAPIVPPVPPGFSPAGVVAAQGPEAKHSRKPLLLVGGAALVGAAAAVLAPGNGSASPLELDVPAFTFTATIPHPGAALSVSRGSLAVILTMSHEPARPLDLLWRLELRADAGGPVCLTMQDTFNGAKRPLGVVLTAPLSATGACGERFDVAVGRLTVDVAGVVVYDTTLTLPFHVEP